MPRARHHDEAEHSEAMPRYLVDLLSAGPDIIAQIPPELIEDGIQTGRVILHGDDPRFTLCLLLGMRVAEILENTIIDKHIK